jgi:YjbE family integral membrane protein
VSLSSELVARILQIVLIDLVLSGDNAVVIGLAAHPLPKQQRQLAIMVGGGAALGLRVALTFVAALLLGLPAIKAVGGVLLLWIAYRLLQEEEDHARTNPTTLQGAIATILVADFIMSLDNVLGVAAASNGDFGLLLTGLAISMAIVMFGGTLISAMIDRFWWLAYLGALVIAWTGADMFQEDALVASAINLPNLAQASISVLVSVLVVAVAHRAHRAQPARASQVSR